MITQIKSLIVVNPVRQSSYSCVPLRGFGGTTMMLYINFFDFNQLYVLSNLNTYLPTLSTMTKPSSGTKWPERHMIIN